MTNEQLPAVSTDREAESSGRRQSPPPSARIADARTIESGIRWAKVNRARRLIASGVYPGAREIDGTVDRLLQDLD